MKITTKLLLGATLVAGLSVSAFAACASHVDMGTKKLENVGAGSADGDAVNVGQIKGRIVDFTIDANTTATFTLSGSVITFPNGETYTFRSHASAQVGCSRSGRYGNYDVSISTYRAYRTGFNVGSKNGSYGALSASVNALFNTLSIRDTDTSESTTCRFVVN